MRRKNLAVLDKWLKNPGRKPLVLRGARQVGKSTLVQIFAEESKYELAEVNLELHKDLDTLFQRMNIEEIIRNLQFLTGKNINKGTILFLDEIQAVPHAIASLRYFHELRPNIPVIAAGSLLEFTLRDHNFSMPVGRIQYLHQGPMSFFEFMEAVNPEHYHYLLSFDLNQKIPDTAHKTLLEYQRDYMLVGGMPEAVQVYSQSRSLEDVKSVHESICNTYIDDFSKYAKNRELADLQRVFRTIPGQIGRKVKYVNYLPDSRSAYTANLLNMLENARIITGIYSTSLSGIPLAANINQKIFKFYFLDIGLLSTMLGLDIAELQNVYDRELINEGPLAEQYIEQQLFNMEYNNLRSGLFYWTRESARSNSEVDFVIAKGSMIIPIEVKSGKTGTLKSLHQVMSEKKLSHAFRFDLQKPSVQKIETKVSTGTELQESIYTLISLPLYLSERLPDFVNTIRKF